MSSDPELEKILKKKMEQLRKQAFSEPKKATPHPTELEDNNFESFINSHELAAVDFWAPWCGPCRIFSPIIEELAEEYSSKIAFGKLNVDENPLTAAKFDVQSIPTLLLFRNGLLVDRIIGAMPKPVVKSVLQKYI